MSAYAPSGGSPEHKGKMMKKGNVKPVGQATQKSHLSTRMKQDDSGAVNMSDRRLGVGVT